MMRRCCRYDLRGLWCHQCDFLTLLGRWCRSWGSNLAENLPTWADDAASKCAKTQEFWAKSQPPR